MPRLIRTLALLGLGYAAVRYLSAPKAMAEPPRRLSGPKSEHKPARAMTKPRAGSKSRSAPARRAARS